MRLIFDRITVQTAGHAYVGLNRRTSILAHFFNDDSDTGLELPTTELRTKGLHQRFSAKQQVTEAHLCGPFQEPRRSTTDRASN